LAFVWFSVWHSSRQQQAANRVSNRLSIGTLPGQKPAEKVVMQSGRQVAARGSLTVKGENKSAPGHGCAFVYTQHNTTPTLKGDKERDAN
jgi:hypothetical protein